MALITPNAGEGRALKHALNHTAPEELKLKLYVNNITPAETDTAGTYTEMTTQGYAEKSLAGASWTITEGAPSSADYAQQTWTFDGTGGTTSVYGYFVVGATSGIIRWAERFSDGPYVVTNNGDLVKVTPKYTAD